MSVTAFTACTDLSYGDARMFYHIVTFTGRLQEKDPHVFAFGLCPMPGFIQQSLEHECAKAALLALSSHHFSMITRSTTLDQLTYAYKENACTHPRHAVQVFSEKNADAVLAASVTLGWGTWEKAHCAKILQGTSAILAQIKERAYRSSLPAVFGDVDPLPTGNRRIVVAYLTFSEEDLLQMRPLMADLERLLQQGRLNTEIGTAACALMNFIRNVPLKRTSDVTEQAEAYNEIHAWTPWTPVATLGLGWRSVPVMALMSFYHAVTIAAEPYLPVAIKAVFPQKRTEVIGRIYTAVSEMQASDDDPPVTQAEIADALEQATVSMVYAVRYRTQHGENP